MTEHSFPIGVLSANDRNRCVAVGNDVEHLPDLQTKEVIIKLTFGPFSQLKLKRKVDSNHFSHD
jgi:hypothetical protein